MGGRTLTARRDRKLREQAARRLRQAGMDPAPFAARLRGVQLVDMLVGFAMDPTLDRKLRRQCALDVLELGFGRPPIRVAVPETEAAAPDPDLDLAAVRAASERHRVLSRWLGVPKKSWPRHVHEMLAEQEAWLAEFEAKNDG